MEHLSNDHKDCYELYDEMEHSDLTLMESQWKLRQQHDQNFPMEGKVMQNKY